MAGAALASTMRSIASMASAMPLPAATSTDEAAAKAACLARMEAEPPFYTKKQVAAGATLAWTMRSIASMASAMPLPAATSTKEAAAKAAYLARMEAESPFRGVQLLRLSRLRPQRVQMRRLPKQLTLLDWKRSRLSARRSK